MDASLPSPPFIDIPGLVNFRDVGGYPIASQPDKMVRQGLIFRSGEPSKITEEGILRLQRLEIKRVYDLRSVQEFDNLGRGTHSRPVKEWEGAERSFVPVFRDEDYSPEAIAVRNMNYGSGPEGFVEAYLAILDAGTSASNIYRPFATILSQFASESPPTPMLIHCSAGKDRTGVICALILSLCGVDDEVVAQEYSLTDLGLKPLHDVIVNHLMQEPAFRDYPEGAIKMVQAKKENMLGTLNAIRMIYGSVEDCVINLGLLSREGVAQLRRHLIVDMM